MDRRKSRVFVALHVGFNGTEGLPGQKGARGARGPIGLSGQKELKECLASLDRKGTKDQKELWSLRIHHQK